MPNRLAAESSPYLLQHAGNPVDWYPWGEEAVSRARSEDKPIFLSIGYSTCHWCHVMEHESFENESIARVLNEHFVSIKVDREERPDVDRVYMLFVQATTGAGGWPMSVWLTPDLKPFYGGTYFPPESKWGRTGFPDVLREIGRLWREDRSRLLASADAMVTRLREAAAGGLETADERIADVDALESGASLYRRAFDARHGGFGSGPKFPRPSELLFLLRAWYVHGDDTARAMVLDTLRAMVTGGMYDHVGGGFHRYAVDGEWRVPHFEKMLYDQAQLVIALLEAAQASGEPFWKWIAAETLEYVERDLSHPDGGFYSAEDADSLPPESDTQPDARKTEGAFYTWSTDEIDDLLGADAEVVKTWFGMLPGGNAPHDPQGEFGTKNILYRSRSLEDVAALVGRPAEDVTATVLRARRRLREVRALRPRPHLDDKVLTAWNGLMIAAFARAARVMDGDLTPAGDDARAHYLARAERAAQFVRRHLWNEDRGTLLRRERAGSAAIDGFAEDYAYFTWGLIELFQATGDPEWLHWAARLQEQQDALFWDEAQGGWFSTTGNDPSILLRLKEDYDGAEPAAASVSVLNLLTLAQLFDREDWRVRAARALARMGQRGGELARQVPLMLCGLAAWHQAPEHVVIVSEPGAAETALLRRALAKHYKPFAVLVPVSAANHDRLAALMPWTRAMTAREGKATAYVCRNFACEAPVTSPDALDALLAAMPAGEPPEPNPEP